MHAKLEYVYVRNGMWNISHRPMGNLNINLIVTFQVLYVIYIVCQANKLWAKVSSFLQNIKKKLIAG